jgi:AGZA family xanthine/uracil permease-like MFS transporter
MARGLAEIDWEELTEVAPAVIGAALMPLTLSRPASDRVSSPMRSPKLSPPGSPAPKPAVLVLALIFAVKFAVGR